MIRKKYIELSGWKINLKRLVVRLAKFWSIADSCPNAKSTSGIKITKLNTTVFSCFE